MKLSRRTHWKPTQKLRKEDLPFLLAEYRVSKNSFYIILSVCVALAAIAVSSSVASLLKPTSELENITGFSVVGIIILLLWGNYFRNKASRIAKVLEIEKRLKRYGID